MPFERILEEEISKALCIVEVYDWGEDGGVEMDVKRKIEGRNATPYFVA
jgi:hypothetical protein